MRALTLGHILAWGMLALAQAELCVVCHLLLRGLQAHPPLKHVLAIAGLFAGLLESRCRACLACQQPRGARAQLPCSTGLCGF
eukprot:s690_g25.t1